MRGIFDYNVYNYVHSMRKRRMCNAFLSYNTSMLINEKDVKNVDKIGG